VYKRNWKYILVWILFIILIIASIYCGVSLLYSLDGAIFDGTVTATDIEKEKLYLEYTDRISELRQEFKHRAEKIDEEFEEKLKALNGKIRGKNE